MFGGTSYTSPAVPLIFRMIWTRVTRPCGGLTGCFRLFDPTASLYFFARMKLITRPALKRIALLFLFLSVIVLLFWWRMIRMPGKSFRGPLPPLTAEQITLRDELRRHVEK